MDDAQVEELHRWAVGLGNDHRPEVKAAAKAICMLAEDLLATRSQHHEDRLILEALEARQQAPAALDDIALTLRRRLRTFLGRTHSAHDEG